MPETITEDGEVITTTVPMLMTDTTALSAIVRAEIDVQISTARAYPRSVDRAVKNILSLTTMDEQTAAEAIYALPRGGKPIRGPSVRLAETIASQWGNNRVDSRVTMIDREEKVVVAEATFHDLENNSATRSTVRRRIVDSKGKLYNDDMIVVTGNAAQSIARRNAILAGVPKPVWRRAYDEAERVIAGDVTTLSETREKGVKAFAVYGVKPEQVFAAIGVRGIDDITLDHIPTLRGMFSSIKNGEETVESLFNARASAPAHDPVANPLKDEPAPVKPEQDRDDAPRVATDADANPEPPETASASTPSAEAAPKPARDIPAELVAKIATFTSAVELGSWWRSDRIAGVVDALTEADSETVQNAYDAKAEELMARAE